MESTNIPKPHRDSTSASGSQVTQISRRVLDSGPVVIQTTPNFPTPCT